MNRSDQFLTFKNNEGESVKMDLLQVKKAAVILRAINHPIRLHILGLLGPNTDTTVTNLVDALGLPQSVVSQHLAILRRAGTIKPRRDGKYIYYSLNTERLSQLNSNVAGIIN